MAKNSTLDKLGEAVPLTDAEKELVQRRLDADKGLSVEDAVERVLDERVGPSARTVRDYPAVADLTVGWDDAPEGHGPQPPAQKPLLPPQGPLTVAGEPVVRLVTAEEAIANVLREHKVNVTDVDAKQTATGGLEVEVTTAKGASTTVEAESTGQDTAEVFAKEEGQP